LVFLLYWKKSLQEKVSPKRSTGVVATPVVLLLPVGRHMVYKSNFSIPAALVLSAQVGAALLQGCRRIHSREEVTCRSYPSYFRAIANHHHISRSLSMKSMKTIALALGLVMGLSFSTYAEGKKCEKAASATKSSCYAEQEVAATTGSEKCSKEAAAACKAKSSSKRVAKKSTKTTKVAKAA
jgi:hypothetical protein